MRKKKLSPDALGMNWLLARIDKNLKFKGK